MPLYDATVYQPDRRHVLLRAESARDARGKLQSQDAFVVALHEKHDTVAARSHFRAQKAVLYRHLAAALSRDTNRFKIHDWLMPMFQRGVWTNDRKWYSAVDSFLRAIAKTSIWRAMEDHPHVFEDYEIGIMHATEQSNGDEAHVLRTMSAALEREQRVARVIRSIVGKLKGAGLVMAIFVYVAFGRLVPALVDTIQHIPNMAIPQPIAGIIAAERWLHGDHVLIVVAGALGIALALWALFRTAAMRRLVDAFIMTDPTIGGIIRRERTARVLFVIQLMIKAAKQADAVTAAIPAAIGPVAKAALLRVRDAQRQSKYPTWAGAFFEGAPLIPHPVAGRFVAADETGRLADEMIHTITDYEEEINEEVAQLNDRLGLALIIVTAVIAFALIAIVYLPANYLVAHFH